MRQLIFSLCFLAVGLIFPVHAQEVESAEDELPRLIKASYTKYEYEIPMRDGVRLFTAVYVPKDDARPYAFMMMRTPYSVAPYGVDEYPESLGPSETFARAGFIFVYQDVRGRYLSEGTFIEMTPHQVEKSDSSIIDESSDTWDTIEWLLDNVENHNGKFGMWGISYPGFYTAAGMIDAHPALVAASPQAPVTDLFRGDDSYHNGAFMLAANFGFFTFFDKHDEPTEGNRKLPFEWGTEDGYQFFLEMGPLSQADEKYFHFENPYWTDLMDHPTYDEFWQVRSLDRFIRNGPPAVLTVGGWFDAEDPVGPFLVYQAMEDRGGATANHLVMGPWSHGSWSWGDGDRLGEVSFHSKTAEFYRDSIEFPFFDYHLNGTGSGEFPKIWSFETGTNRWRRFAAWPPPGGTPQKIFFREGGELSFVAPTEAGAWDGYLSDPNRPVPSTEEITRRPPGDYMVYDQRFATKRPDVLVYVSEPLEEDLTIAGAIRPELWVDTTGTDADFVVKVIDVYPHDFPNDSKTESGVVMGGYQQLVRGEPFRAKFRNSLQEPEPLTPGELTPLAFEMPGISHVFRRGHRIMVQVQSSWFPLVDRNPQAFVDIPNASAEDFQAQTHRVHRSAGASSGVVLPVLD